MTANGSAAPGSAGADLFTAITGIISAADAGGIKSKQRAFLQLGEALEYEEGALAAFATRLAEPGQQYSAAVWEPLRQAAAHLRAARSRVGESSSALSQVTSVTVGEAASSGVRVPHHEQINRE